MACFCEWSFIGTFFNGSWPGRKKDSFAVWPFFNFWLALGLAWAKGLYFLEMKKRQKGVSYIEVLLAMTILGILAFMAMGGINFLKNIFKADDARRKNDLVLLKVAMEGYFDDRGCYPGLAMAAQMNQEAACGGEILSPYMPRFLCEKGKTPYFLEVEDSLCPKWFRFMVNLDNVNDPVLEEGGCGADGCPLRVKVPEGTEVISPNYGVSSDNISWTEIGNICGVTCAYFNPESRTCDHVTHCVTGCYSDYGCTPGCEVSSCTD